MFVGADTCFLCKVAVKKRWDQAVAHSQDSHDSNDVGTWMCMGAVPPALVDGERPLRLSEMLMGTGRVANQQQFMTNSRKVRWSLVHSSVDS